MNDLEYLTKGKKYVTVKDWRPAQFHPSLLICLAPFSVRPIPLETYPMGSSSPHMLKGFDIPLCVGGGEPHWGRVLEMRPHQHYKGLLLGLSASAVQSSSQEPQNLQSLVTGNQAKESPLLLSGDDGSGKLESILRTLPQMPMWSSFSSGLLQGIISEAFEKSKKTTWVEHWSSSHWVQWWIVASSCVWQENPLWNPCWSGLSFLCLIRKSLSLVWMNRSMTLDVRLVRLTGQ